jgi:hypothetical protein
MTRATKPMLSLLFTFGALAAFGPGERAARADVCFSSGHHYGTPDASPDTHDTPDAQDAQDGQVVGFRRGTPTGRTAGTGLVLAAGLGLAWIGGRRKDQTSARRDQDVTKTAADRRPPTERSP